MQDLKVVGVDSGSLLLVADGGERYRITLDELAQAGIRSSRLEPQRENGRRVPPKEIQAHIRAGLSANEVAAVTGADLSYVQRFEGPVVAEREYVIEAARAVRVRSALDGESLGDATTFGSVITHRLSEREGTDERWKAWKQADGPWTLQVAYDVAGTERTARWSFDVKRQLLAPLDNDAILLSHDGDDEPPVPRLRAVDADHPARRDTSRFDSGAFEPLDVEQPRGPRRLDTASAGMREASQDVVEHAEERADDAANEPDSGPPPQTTDLLEALRRRRGERRPAGPYHESQSGDRLDSVFEETAFEETAFDSAVSEAPDTESASADPVSAVTDASADDALFDGAAELGITSLDLPFESFPEPVPKAAPRQPKRTSSRRGRAAMPSWDEIVFGTKPDDPA